MKPAFHLYRPGFLGVALATLVGCGAGADFFSWEGSGVSGLFTDPNRWHGPDYPAHTRYPGATDDANIDHGELTITIAGEQATHELVAGGQTLDVSGVYRVAQLSAYGAPLALRGGGTTDIGLWLMGDLGMVDQVEVRVGTLQPLGVSPPSKMQIRNGGVVQSGVLDASRGALRVVVGGPGSLWRHEAGVRLVQLVLEANGRMEVPAADDVYVTAEGSDARLSVAGRFSGYGRIGGGARVECGDGTAAGQNLVVDGGSWVVRESLVNDGVDLTIQQGGVVKATRMVPGTFGGVTSVSGGNSRLDVAGTLRPLGRILINQGGRVTAGTADFDLGGAIAETGGRLEVGEALVLNSGVSVLDGGGLAAPTARLATRQNSGALMLIRGAGSRAEGVGTWVFGEAGEAFVNVEAGGGLAVSTLVVGRSAGDNQLSVSGPDARLGVTEELVVGETARGRGTVSLRDRAQAEVKRLVIGRNSSAESRVALEGPGTRVTAAGRIDVGEQAGFGRLELSNTAEARPGAGLSVGIYEGSQGSLLVDGGATLVTPKEAIIGGNDRSHGEVMVRGGGSLEALDVLVFAPGSGMAAVTVTDGGSALTAAQQIQVGFVRGTPGPTTMRIANGALASAGEWLVVGRNGRLEVPGGKVKVGVAEYPEPGTIRVGAGGGLAGQGRVQGNVEVLAGGRVAPGSSPGTLTIEGGCRVSAGGVLEFEVGGTLAGMRHDVLRITGSATLAGTLAIRFVEGFPPKAGERYALMTVDGGIGGAFEKVEVEGVAPGFGQRLVRDGSGLFLEALTDGVAVSAPRLDFERRGSDLVMSWPADPAVVLLSSIGLTGVWVDSGEEWSTQDGRVVVTVRTQGEGRIYRLVRR